MQNSGPTDSWIAVLGPATDVIPCPVVHPDSPSLPALLGANQHRPGLRVQIGLSEGERFADPSPARHRIAISARVLSAYGPGPAWRITRMISSTVGGSAG